MIINIKYSIGNVVRYNDIFGEQSTGTINNLEAMYDGATMSILYLVDDCIMVFEEDIIKEVRLLSII